MAADSQVLRRDDFKERVRAATDIQSLIGDRTKLTGSREDLRGKCPLHSGGNPTSLSVNAEKGVWHCNACDGKGDCFSWVMAAQEVEFPEALRILADRTGIQPDPVARPPARPGDPVEQLAAIRRWDPEALSALGARGEEGPGGRPLVVLPMRNAQANVVGWRERGADNRPLPVGRGESAKSKTRQGTSLGLFYTPDLPELPEPWLVVEGEADAAAAISSGQQATIGTAGASASRASLTWLQTLAEGREVVIAPDPDAAGHRWRDRLVRLLANAGCTVRLIVPEEDRDLDERLRMADDPVTELARLVGEARPYEPPEEAPEFAAFLDARGKPVLPRIAEHLHSKAPVFALGKQLYRYEKGAYQPDGEQRIRADLTEVLGESYSSYACREVLSYLRDRYPLYADDVQDATALLDPDPHVLNVSNGLLDVRQLSLRPHDPSYRSTLQVPHDFDPQAECPAIDRFLHEVFPDDAVTLAYEFMGSLLRRDLNPEQVLLLIGDGRNGKSIFIQLLRALLGHHNCSAVSVQQLDNSRFHPINLMGKLANFCADLPATSLRDTSTFKRAVSRDPIEGERKGVQPITFTPFCKFVFACNTIPATSDHSPAFYRRWLPVEFLNTFVDASEYDPTNSPPNHRPARDRAELLEELSDPAELRGLLVRSLRAAQEVADRGGRYSEPDSR